MPVRIVTDSASDLTIEQAKEHEIEVVPLTIRFGDDEFVDRIELTVEDFYARMASSSHMPETAAPAPGAFEAAFRRCAAEGADEVVCINISSGLSATMQSAQAAATSLAGELPVHVVDSKSVTLGLGSIVLAAADAAASGRSAASIAADAAAMAERQRVFGTLDTLENLKKGGRVGNAQALLGTLLSIKPCIEIGNEGIVEEAGRARTRKKALQWLAAKVLDERSVEDLWVLHGQAPDVDEFLSLLAPRYGPGDLSVGVIGPVIATHGGPRVLGVTYRVPR
jgi:DegV family protein with EDD domain